MSTNAKLWWVIGAAWGLLLLGLGAWSAFSSPPTVRDQSPLASAKETTETVVGQIRATVPTEAFFQDSGYSESTCSLTPVRSGTSAVRTLTVTGLTGMEAATLRSLHGALKGSVLQPGDGIPTGFFYDASNFIVVRGEITEPGKLTVELKTGCRPNE
ncbi:hypothetical protein [Catelliglobosispora koreensis]|uniref:hypothetical protein n=1 Tax=Catelliglobosispora koreensis TaxID=129052 RepID=UPI000369233F|nr:hypothetical protein [Catelliglobosispora koreensis]